MKQVRNLHELAVLAGVSASTVSRALADSPVVRRSTRERIKSLALENAFQPNVMARNLRNRCTGAIAVAIPLGPESSQSLADPFFITMLGLLGDILSGHALDLLLLRNVHSSPDWLDDLVKSGRVDGVIVLGQSDQFDTIENLARVYRPLVVWGAHQPGQAQCSVGSDNRLGGRLAADHLIDRGCRRLAFMGDPRSIEIDQRLAGCREAMQRAGMAGAPQVVPVSFAASAAGHDIARFLRTTPDCPDGIIAASDMIAMSALKALADFGVTVPGDVKVIGFDGLAIGEMAVPALSTVRQNFAAGAVHLVDMLLQRIAGIDAPGIVMIPELQPGMST